MCLALTWVLLAGNRETLGRGRSSWPGVGVRGDRCFHQSFYLWLCSHCGLPEGWLLSRRIEPQNLPALSLTCGNPLPGVTAVLFPKQAMSFQVSQSQLTLSPSLWTRSSPFPVSSWEVLLLLHRPGPVSPTLWTSLQTLASCRGGTAPSSSPPAPTVPSHRESTYIWYGCLFLHFYVFFLLGPHFLLLLFYRFHSLDYILANHYRKE